MRTELMGVAPRGGPPVIEATPVGATYRVVDERVVPSKAGCLAERVGPGDAFEQAVFSAVAKTGALFVGFVAMILRCVLGVVMCLSLVVCAAYVLLGFVTGVHRLDFVGLFFGVAFASFVAIFVVTQFEVWVCRLARIDRG